MAEKSTKFILKPLIHAKILKICETHKRSMQKELEYLVEKEYKSLVRQKED